MPLKIIMTSLLQAAPNPIADDVKYNDQVLRCKKETRKSTYVRLPIVIAHFAPIMAIIGGAARLPNVKNP